MAAKPKRKLTPEEERQIELRRLWLCGRQLAVAGCRPIEIGGQPAIGIWSDLDHPSLRTAIRDYYAALWPAMAGAPIVYLDGPGIPDRFKERRVPRVPTREDGRPADPIPLEVVEAMMRSDEPWKVREHMLDELGWLRKRAPWHEYCARWRKVAP
jgi:hypothetical protein